MRVSISSAAHVRLFRTHVLRRSDQLSGGGEQGLVGKRLVHRLGHTEVDDLRRRLAVLHRDQHVGGLESRWMMPFWWACWIASQTRHEQLEALAARVVVVAVLGDRNTLDQFHHEVGPARLGGPGVEDLGDVGMIHQCQGLPLGLEARDDLLGVHPGLMIFRATLRRTGSICSAR